MGWFAVVWDSGMARWMVVSAGLDFIVFTFRDVLDGRD
ncbi:MAG: hypothetical protein HW380_3097 [Magnetococcales bacterium]|nr:hypothetical protein [Magnetococcales bacterium]